MNQKPAFIALSGLFLIGIGIVAFFGLPFLVLEEVYKRLELTEGSESYEIWKEIPLPMYQKFYFYNVTNSVDVERLGSKPILKEIGPFTYRVFLKKNNINFNRNGTVTYRESKSWQFQPHLSFASESQTIVTLNTPLAFTLTLLQSATPTVRVIVTLALDAVTEGFFIKRSVKQLLFDGYPDLLTTFGPLLNPGIPNNNQGKFGFFYPKNNTDDGLFTTFTGESGIEQLNLIDMYNGRPNLNFWSSGDCNSLKGATNGELRPPFKPKLDNIKFFNPDICRVLNLKREKNVELFSIQATRFKLDENTFKNKNDYPPNACYTSKIPKPQPQLINLQRTPAAQRLRQPFPSGVFDVSNCRYGVPLMLSAPHFLNADQYYFSTIDGMSPNESLHGFWVDIDPTTGSTVGMALRLQVNVYITRYPGLVRYRNIPEIIFPIFWQEFQVSFTEDLAENLKMANRVPGLVASVTGYSFGVVGIILLIAALFITLIPFYKLHKAEITGVVSAPTDDRSKREDGTKDDVKIISKRMSTVELGVDNPIPVT
ncbi:scavenger receptor class B member 1-like protein [Leptotrombidium deliense]|uniref:Scavenger receptor class B member 1 n=1 Tax=Leptotrombidium deliense TaxID=299467 RepID=A0A443SQ35_9ACAR|nr:scavenger receptor class B member 1-like protein [Leptotrombidium deliense]